MERSYAEFSRYNLQTQEDEKLENLDLTSESKLKLGSLSRSWDNRAFASTGFGPKRLR